MENKVKDEVEAIIIALNLDCTVDEFEDKVDWYDISRDIDFSSEFIRNFQNKVIWSYISEFHILSQDFIKEFQDRLFWDSISRVQLLSEQLIREFNVKLNWYYISYYQTLSEDFIEEFQDKVDWDCISLSQTLSEDFIEKFQDKFHWMNISSRQTLSEDFIKKFKDKVHWNNISEYQVLSEDFINAFKDKIDVRLQHLVTKTKSLMEKKSEIKRYAKKYNLKVDDKYLYAFRYHNKYGNGSFKNNMYYEKGRYYRDWHCDMRKDVQNSYGLGIYPEGNTPVRVKISDWGVWVDENKNENNGQCRVWGFEMI